MYGTVFDIAECSIHDGPGMRITLFFKGCPLRCRWCHSPEGQSPEVEMLHLENLEPRICGKKWSVKELSSYLNKKVKLLDGGVTFSGGEPLMQSDFLSALLDELQGVHTIVDSCGFAPKEKFLEIARKVSMFFFGLKLLDDEQSRYWTKQECGIVKNNLLLLDRETDTPYRLRIPLLSGVTDTTEYLRELEKFCRQLKRITEIDFLPSNPEAGAKYAACSRVFEPSFDVKKQAVLPDWFDPHCPVRQLSAEQIG